MPRHFLRSAAAAIVATFVSAAPAMSQATAAAAPDTVLPAAALLQDVAVLRQALEAIHPGLHRHATPAELQRGFTRLEARLASGATLKQAYLALTEFTATIRCGHTFPNPFNQGARVSQVVFRDTPRVPFYFRWIDGRMVVTHDASTERAFPRGTEVLAINGVATPTILARLLPYMRADGDNTPKRISSLGLQPAEKWQAFDVYYPLVFPAAAGEWTYRLRLPTGVSRTTRAATVDVAHRTAVFDSVSRTLGRDSSTPPWTVAVEPDGIATLTMQTWVTFNDTWDWKGWIHRTFRELNERHVSALVIDLRGNEGGSSVGDVILEHLVDRDVTLRQFQRYTSYQRIPPALRPYLDTWDRSFDDWGSKTAPADAPPGAGATGFYRLTRYDDDSTGTVIHPSGPRFTGRVFVLVGAENSSATFEFALAMRQLKLGTLVGQVTGGNQQGINGGAFYFLRLPNSRLEVDLPLIGYFPATAKPDGGIAPDVPVRLTAADIASGRDPAMIAVRATLAQSRKAGVPSARK